MTIRFAHSTFSRARMFAGMLAGAGLMFSAPVHAQIRVGTSLVMVDATVKTKNGEIMDGLQQGDFIVREDGVQQKLQVFSRDTLPLNLVLLLDTSASTGPYLNALRQAASFALSALKPEDQVALMTFSSEAVLRVPFTNDKNQSAAEIAVLETGGTTNVNDALYISANYLHNNEPTGRRVIILISDDVATDPGKYETPEIIGEALAADVAVYNLRLPDLNSPREHEISSHIPGLVDMRKVLDGTGGESFDVRDVLHMDVVFRSLIDRIKTRYTLGYYVSADQAHGKEHMLEVRLAPSFGTKGRNYLVLAKSGYVSP